MESAHVAQTFAAPDRFNHFHNDMSQLARPHTRISFSGRIHLICLLLLSSMLFVGAPARAQDDYSWINERDTGWSGLIASLGVGFTPVGIVADLRDLGAAVKKGSILGIGLGVVRLIPGVSEAGKLGGKIFGKGANEAVDAATHGLDNIGGGVATAEKALAHAQDWLGTGYKEIAPGVFRSADNTRQFRMTMNDLAGGKQAPHVHRESIAEGGKIIMENSHVLISDP